MSEPVEWFRNWHTDVIHKGSCRYAAQSVPWMYGSEVQPKTATLRQLARRQEGVNPCKVCCPEAWEVEQ